MSDSSSEKSEMSCPFEEAERLVHGVAPDGPTIERRIEKAARRLGWSFTRTRDIWYRQARRIDSREMDALRAALKKQQIEEARRERNELVSRIERLEARLAVVDQDFHREQVTALRQAHGGFGDMDRPRDSGD